MKRLLFTYLSIIILINNGSCQEKKIDHDLVKLNLNQLLNDLKENYVYFEKKNIDYDCLMHSYENKINDLGNNTDVVLFFEKLLLEFADSHLHLNTHTDYSYRLYSPIYTKFINETLIITDIWKSQLKTQPNFNIIGSEILKINSVPIEEHIKNFPTVCGNKQDSATKEWIVNKIIAGKYNERRILTLKLENGTLTEFDIDDLVLKTDESVLNYSIIDNIGVLRINNSLGDSNLRDLIEDTYESLKNTKGIILDLRNTIDGGDTYIAYSLIQHFVNENKDFQKYLNKNESFIDNLEPRDPYLKKKLVLIVGRWTGSVGEGLASGVKNNSLGIVIGSEMAKLGGAMKSFSFKGYQYGYSIPYIDVLQLNNKPRTEFIPEVIIENDNSNKDNVLESALEIIKK